MSFLYIAIIVLVCIMYIIISKRTQEKQKKNDEALVEEQYQSLYSSITNILNQTDISLPPAYDNVRRRLVQWRFYYSKENSTAYLVVNLDKDGRKALYKSTDAGFTLVRTEAKADAFTGMAFNLALSNCGENQIKEFNDMARILPEQCIDYFYQEYFD